MASTRPVERCPPRGPSEDILEVDVRTPPPRRASKGIPECISEKDPLPLAISLHLGRLAFPMKRSDRA
ncbi:hypothetical protein HPP92_024610 [Vanilla planifolia]|uniref:Uncharacterized protein n=1 Tax=Vanilla planifolia TaxID=51239 RepID=A0A835PVI9_VANPL|nr:hypothetical protein HPP92_024610 [Vanilla planifolia]